MTNSQKNQETNRSYLPHLFIAVLFSIYFIIMAYFEPSEIWRAIFLVLACIIFIIFDLKTQANHKVNVAKAIIYPLLALFFIYLSKSLVSSNYSVILNEFAYFLAGISVNHFSSISKKG